MDKESVVDDRIAGARELVNYLTQQGRLEVSAAYWMEVLDDDDRKRRLHIITPYVDEVGLRDAYVALIHTFRDHPDIPFYIEDVALKSPEDRAVVEILDFLRHYPLSEAYRLKGVYIKGRYVERAGIYPVMLDEGSAVSK